MIYRAIGEIRKTFMSRKQLSSNQKVGDRKTQDSLSKKNIWPSREACRKLNFGMPVALVPTPSVEKYVMEWYGVTLRSPLASAELSILPQIRPGLKTIVTPTAPPAESISCEKFSRMKESRQISPWNRLG